MVGPQHWGRSVFSRGAEVSFARGRSVFSLGVEVSLDGAEVSFSKGAEGAAVVGAEVVRAEVSNPHLF